MPHERDRRRLKWLLPVGLAGYLAITALTLSQNDQLDLFVYRGGAKLALEGSSPYSTELLRNTAAQAFPPKNDADFALNCGFFLPPQAIAIFAPLALVEWTVAEVFWFCLLTACGLACGTLAWTFGRSPPHRGKGWEFIVLAVLLNPITLPALVVGQTGLLMAASVALGQLCFERGRPSLGCILWALSFVKPHVALPLLVVAWVLGGWKRAAGIALVVTALNLLGGLIARGSFEGSIRLFHEYLAYLGAGHKEVKYNLVSANYQILSWNRMVAALGGPAPDLNVWMTLVGYALWAGLIFFRFRWSAKNSLDRNQIDAAYLLAAAVTGALLFAQVLAYEMVLLVLLAPLIAQHVDAGRRWDAYILIGLLVFLMVPLNLTDRIADSLQCGTESLGRTLLRSHKCFGMAALSLYLLMRGPATGSGAPGASATGV